MKFRRVQSYKLRRLFPMLGIAGIATLGTVGCEKEDDFKTQIRTETKHDTVYVKPDTVNSVKSDTVYLPGDTIYLPGDTVHTKPDTVYIPGDTVHTKPDTVYIPGDTVHIKPDIVYIPGDTVYIPGDTVYIPGDTVYVKPDTVYTPSKPDIVYIPGDTVYIPGDTVYIKPDTVYIPIERHNTTYVWGDNNWNAIWPEITDNVAKSADSTIVDKVILKNDGRSLGGTRTSDLMGWMDVVIQSVSPENRYKVRGSGTLETTGIANQQDVQDSIRLSTLGFSFGKVVYHDSFQR